DPDGARGDAPEARFRFVVRDRVAAQQSADFVRLVVRNVAQIEKKLCHSQGPFTRVGLLSHKRISVVNTARARRRGDALYAALDSGSVTYVERRGSPCVGGLSIGESSEGAAWREFSPHGLQRMLRAPCRVSHADLLPGS